MFNAKYNGKIARNNNNKKCINFQNGKRNNVYQVFLPSFSFLALVPPRNETDTRNQRKILHKIDAFPTFFWVKKCSPFLEASGDPSLFLRKLQILEIKTFLLLWLWFNKRGCFGIKTSAKID